MVVEQKAPVGALSDPGLWRAISDALLILVLVEKSNG
jgi:hypothetical protein